MLFKINLLVAFFLVMHQFMMAAPDNLPVNEDFSEVISDTGFCSEKTDQILIQQRPNPILQSFRSKLKKKKQSVAAMLAFPLPFGIVGLHRIYLGCAPYVPVAYIASLGGMFGVLPLIDFCVLLLKKDTDQYCDNEKIFMWVN